MTVRLRHSAALAQMLLVFFRRKVLRVGVLRSTPVRVFTVSAAVLLLAVMCTSAYLFLEPVGDDPTVWRLLFDTSTVSLVLWVQIAFLLVKVLFINAEGMLQLTFHLPVTNRERSAAFLMYEAAMTGIVAGIGLVSLAVSGLLLLGPAALPYITASVLLPVVLTYLVLGVLYQVLSRLWSLLRLRRIADVLSVLALFALLALYSAGMKDSYTEISEAYLQDRPHRLWVTAVSWAWQRHGALPTLAVTLLLVAVLVALSLALAPNQHVRQSRYLPVRTRRARGRELLGPYDLCLLRSAQTVAGAVMATALFGYLLLRPSVHPLWGLSVLSLGGLYQFTATQALRMLPGARASAWRVYGRLLKAQLVLLAVFTVPALALVLLVDWRLGLQSGPALLGCLGGAVLTTCISVVFPAEKDNPFSVFLGLSVVAVVLAVSAIGLGMLDLPPWAVLVCLVGATALFVWYAVEGIRTNESRRRNEEGTVGHGLRHRGGAADLRDRGGRAAPADVLDGQ